MHYRTTQVMAISFRVKYKQSVIAWNVAQKYDLKVKQSRYRPEVAQSVPGIKISRFHDNGTGWW